jgi:RNA polymerase sigma-70 factor, ECF subfamily
VGDAEDLIAAALAGDRVALGAFIRETQADVWRYCAYLGRGLETDDLVQETYLRALRALPKYQGRAPARVWLLGIARRVCADAIRSAQRRRRIDMLLTRVPAHHPDIAGHVTLIAIVSVLPREQRDALVLTQVIGVSYDEAAQICSVPIGTIRSRVARGREGLQRQLQRDAG